MKRLNYFYLCLVCILFLQTLNAQDDTEPYYKFRALLKTGDRVEIEKGKLTDSTLINFMSENDQKVIPLSEIRALDRRVGSKALLGLGIGLGIGVTSSLLAVAQIEADPYRKLKDNAAEIFAGITIGCGLIGLLVGSAYDQWEKIPLVNSSNTSVKADFNNGSYQLSIRINF